MTPQGNREGAGNTGMGFPKVPAVLPVPVRPVLAPVARTLKNEEDAKTDPRTLLETTRLRRELPEPPPPVPAPADRIPPSVQKLMQSTPLREWGRIRAFLIESEEEGDLVEMLPEMRRVMKICPPKLIGRVRKREITGEDLDRGYRQLHEALHRVREAMHALLLLAGYRDFRLPGPGKGAKNAEAAAATAPVATSPPRP